MSEEFAKNIKSKKGLPDWFNFLSALLGLIVLSPLFILVSILIKITSKGSVFFKQKRVGKDFKEFYLFKFRTMKANPQDVKITAKGDKRITKIGRILRKTKIDELPQLINVIKGDMAIVGPRPEVKEYVELDIDNWRKILKVKPGITDPVTLKLRNEEELLARVENREQFYKLYLSKYKIKGYIHYVENRSLLYDLKLIFLTLLATILPTLKEPPKLDEIYEGWKDGK